MNRHNRHEFLQEFFHAGLRPAVFSGVSGDPRPFNVRVKNSKTAHVGVIVKFYDSRTGRVCIMGELNVQKYVHAAKRT